MVLVEVEKVMTAMVGGFEGLTEVCIGCDEDYEPGFGGLQHWPRQEGVALEDCTFGGAPRVPSHDSLS